MALAAGMSSAARADEPDLIVEFPAGVACADFGLKVKLRGGNQHIKEFRDSDGRLVRAITAGTKPGLTLINASTQASVVIRANGSVQHTSYASDGTQTVTSTGNTLLIMFPTDVPAGPSTTLYAGQLVWTVDSAEVGTLLKVRGTSTDMCAALAG